MSASVKVAVRVRPFNARETGRHAVSVITMEGKTTCELWRVPSLCTAPLRSLSLSIGLAIYLTP